MESRLALRSGGPGRILASVSYVLMCFAWNTRVDFDAAAVDDVMLIYVLCEMQTGAYALV